MWQFSMILFSVAEAIQVVAIISWIPERNLLEEKKNPKQTQTKKNPAKVDSHCVSQLVSLLLFQIWMTPHRKCWVPAICWPNGKQLNVTWKEIKAMTEALGELSVSEEIHAKIKSKMNWWTAAPTY